MNIVWGTLVIASLSFLLGSTWRYIGSSLSSQPNFAPTTILSSQTATEDNAAADGICQAHRVAIRLSPGAPSLAPMVHELLDVDVSSWPFVPVQSLVARPNGKQARAADVSVIDAYDARAREAGIWTNLGDDDGEDEVHNNKNKNKKDGDVVVVGLALSLASEVLLVPASRNLYLSKVVPLVEKAAVKATGGKRETEKKEKDTAQQQEARVNELIQWCREHSRVEM